MPPLKLLVLSATALGVPLISLLTIRYFKERYIKKSAVLKVQKPYYYSYVFTSHNIKCVRHVHENTICGETCSNFYLNTILTAISSAKKTISLCMYHLTLESIAKVILEAHMHNVNVRIITDKEMSFATGSQINHLKNSGITIKTPSRNIGLLHHKFCLIDENVPADAKILFGSMNYTIQGLCNNWDNIMFTNDLNIISKFSNDFESVWGRYC